MLEAVLDEVGATGALATALELAQLDEPPATREGMFKFVEGPLQEALVGTLHPATVAHVLASVREQLAGVDRSGTRMRSDPEIREPASQPPGAPTMPPPAGPGAQGDYADLVSGAIHSRVTPAWGMLRVDSDVPPGEAVWVIVSNDAGLIRSAQRGAPPGVDVVVASSMAVLAGALSRGVSSASAVILDAADPSISMDRAIACLTSDAMNIRVILWRMPSDRRVRLIEAIPHAGAWLPCEAEVTPAEILHLLLM